MSFAFRTLTKCLHALVTLLYPFSWQHTFIPILPSQLLEVTQSPTPFIVGLLIKDYCDLRPEELDSTVLILDLDNDVLLRSSGKCSA